MHAYAHSGCCRSAVAAFWADLKTSRKTQCGYICGVVEFMGNVCKCSVFDSNRTEEMGGNKAYWSKKVTLDGNLNPKEEHEENKNEVSVTKSINIYLFSFLSLFKVIRLCKITSILGVCNEYTYTVYITSTAKKGGQWKGVLYTT